MPGLYRGEKNTFLSNVEVTQSTKLLNAGLNIFRMEDLHRGRSLCQSKLDSVMYLNIIRVFAFFPSIIISNDKLDNYTDKKYNYTCNIQVSA